MVTSFSSPSFLELEFVHLRALQTNHAAHGMAARDSLTLPRNARPYRSITDTESQRRGGAAGVFPPTPHPRGGGPPRLRPLPRPRGSTMFPRARQSRPPKPPPP